MDQSPGPGRAVNSSGLSPATAWRSRAPHPTYSSISCLSIETPCRKRTTRPSSTTSGRAAIVGVLVGKPSHWCTLYDGHFVGVIRSRSGGLAQLPGLPQARKQLFIGQVGRIHDRHKIDLWVIEPMASLRLQHQHGAGKSPETFSAPFGSAAFAEARHSVFLPPNPKRPFAKLEASSFGQSARLFALRPPLPSMEWTSFLQSVDAFVPD